MYLSVLLTQLNSTSHPKGSSQEKEAQELNRTPDFLNNSQDVFECLYVLQCNIASSK